MKNDEFYVGYLPKAPEKLSASVRTIPVPPWTVERVEAHAERFGTGPDGLLVTNHEQQPLQRWHLSDPWRRAALQVGLPTGTGLHCIRHYYASLLIRSGCSVKVVQARLGHATAGETLHQRRVLHVVDDLRIQMAAGAADRQARALGGAGNPRAGAPVADKLDLMLRFHGRPNLK